jgi:hypothetical protein
MRTYTEELITPEIATQFMSGNTHNRKLKPGRILAYADAIKNNRWRINGEGIKFSKSGTLLDGQNRLTAVIKAGVPAQMLVVRGLDDDDQATMDTGAPRTLSDILTLRGEKNSALLSAVVRSLYVWDNTADAARRFVGGANTGNSHVGGNSKWMSPDELLAYFEGHADSCRHLAAKSDHCRRQTKIPASILAPLIREMERISYEDSEDFLHRLENMMPSPKNFGENDPIVQLNKRLRTMFPDKGRKALYVQTELAALVVKAWNAYRDGTPIANLRWRSGGNAPESFPVMK